MTADDVRARFEEAMSRVGYLFTRDGDGYMEPSMTFAWIGYRAAHADLSAEVRELVEVCQDIEPWLAKHIVGGQLANRLRAALAKFTQEKP